MRALRRRAPATGARWRGGGIACAIHGTPEPEARKVSRTSGERAHARRFDAEPQAVG